MARRSLSWGVSITTGPERAIRRLLQMEHGVRKAARIMLFINRRQLLEIFVRLPDPIVIQLAREMILLRLEIPDLVRERERVADELGQLTEVIDLAPPSSLAVGGLDFLSDCDPQQLARLAATLDLGTLAAVVCNAATDVAAIMIASAGTGQTRHDLLDEMSRMKSGNVPDHLLDSLRETLERLRSPLEPDEDQPAAQRTSSRGPSFESLVSRTTEETQLARLLGTLPTDQLAMALLGADTLLRDRIKLLLSSRRWEDVISELAWHEEAGPAEINAARKALVRRLIKGLDEC